MSNLMNTVQGALGNYNEVPISQLFNEYGMYLMKNEIIVVGFKLIRDALIITDKRIIFVDRQGLTGMKIRIKSINLQSIIGGTLETAGFGIDDTDLYFTYVSSPDLKGFQVHFITQKVEFPQHFNIQPLYMYLQELAYNNYLRINNLI